MEWTDAFSRRARPVPWQAASHVPRLDDALGDYAQVLCAPPRGRAGRHHLLHRHVNASGPRPRALPSPFRLAVSAPSAQRAACVLPARSPALTHTQASASSPAPSSARLLPTALYSCISGGRTWSSASHAQSSRSRASQRPLVPARPCKTLTQTCAPRGAGCIVAARWRFRRSSRKPHGVGVSGGRQSCSIGDTLGLKLYCIRKKKNA